ncbi:MAG: flagellar protein export ATPase FliI [Clostridia bacterium]|nr:flagellar protein export ATPase FliI [Candidatus Pelethousia sp.]NCB30018.1 flagellar protein export ATPase FliI [Clostridia bacterium]
MTEHEQNRIKTYFQALNRRLAETDSLEYSGAAARIIGMTVEAEGPASSIGDLCRIYQTRGNGYVLAEVEGFKENKVLLMPLGPLTGLSPGDRIISTGTCLQVGVCEGLQGRILGALGTPIDGGDALAPETFYPLDNDPPGPLRRARIHDVLPMGVRAIDGLLTIGIGQRMGIFAGSGVGKSTLLGMIARNAKADINVIVLVGERGREVKDFVEKDLKEEGLKKSVLVVATSDQPALLRLKSAMVGTSIAEYFRDKGKKVLLLMDSLTRFAMAQREIGMAIGEPPVARGFTPSVYAMLPRLLERSGTSDKGSITAIYTVLVEGDDMNEPISDTVRGILDGHMVLSRKLANSNHYPPIDVLQSVSRLMREIVSPEHAEMADKIRNHMATYRDAQDLISIGAYKPGSNPTIDQAVRLRQPIADFLIQRMDEAGGMEIALERMRKLLG